MGNQQIQTIRISGISCDACIQLITRLFSRMKGVNSVLSVNKNGMAQVSVESKLTKKDFADALADTAYSVDSVQ